MTLADITSVTSWASLKDWQTLVVGIVGFTGVIITLIVNAWVVRRVRREERRHERQALRTALIEELKINSNTLSENVANLNRMDQ